jgi:hypothetical protein
MEGLVRYVTLTAKAKTGLGTDVVVWALAAFLCAAITLVFLLASAFIALADAYSPLTAALILVGVFLLGAILAGILCLTSQRRNVEEAKRAVTVRGNAMATWLNPRFLGIGLDVIRSIGLRRLVPIAAAGILAGGLAREWMVHSRPPVDAADDLDEA